MKIDRAFIDFPPIEPSGKVDDAEGILWPILHKAMVLIAEYRQAVRGVAQGSEIAEKAVKMAVLKACDSLRDDLLPACNIRLQDKALIGCNDADVPAVGYLPKWILLEMKKERENVGASF